MPPLPTFAEFSQALDGGRKPFAWQERAAAELRAHGWWPSLTAPTGAGKTRLIDAWLWAVAYAGPERLGRRLFWVVDRRAVVDQVHQHAQDIAGALAAKDAAPPLVAIREALLSHGRANSAAPLHTVLWRGGLDDATREDTATLLNPSQVAVVCTTVDQLGSRLLFRGYGVGSGSRAAHAGLVGMDSAIVVDEAHLSGPLIDSLARVQAAQALAIETPRPTTRAIAITATPTADSAFSLTPAELEEPLIARRIRAQKWVTLHDGPAKPADIARMARRLAVDRQQVGIVLNTVGEARAVFDAIEDPVDSVLLIGPVRPLDRSHAINSIPIGRAYSTARADGPTFIVATQTIEVGVDLDFDALITACAPVPALVQRLGRLDRVGELAKSDVVVLEPPRECPVYGDDTADAWHWLLEAQAAGAGRFELGSAAVARLRTDLPWPSPRPPARAPVLLPHHIAALTWTALGPSESPDIGLFLHGPRDIENDVTVIWRADIDVDLSDEEVSRRVEMRPPYSGEGLSLSRSALSRWLASDDEMPVADVPVPVHDAVRRSAHSRSRKAWIFTRGRRTERTAKAATPWRIPPGATVVIPARLGGCDEFGWAPSSTRPVTDLASLRRSRPLAVVRSDEDGAVARALGDHEAGLTTNDDLRTAALGAIRMQLPQEARYADRRAECEAAFASGTIEVLPDATGLRLVGAANTRAAARRTSVVSLDDHLAGVAERARTLAEGLGLPAALVADIHLAARHHDEGKRDVRFQAWLSGGRPTTETLAKSAYQPLPARRERLRALAQWPKGKRHELASAELLRIAKPERLLPAWLALTHHGRHRPHVHRVPDTAEAGSSLSATIEGRPVTVNCDACPDAAWVFATFDELTSRFGPWGLALLEAVMVAADRTVSAAGRGH